MILTQGIRRMRFRNSYSNEELMTPGEIYPVKIELHDLSINFLAGHSIRVIVTNSNYPMFDINLNNGDSLYVPGDTLIAKTYLHHWGNYKSKVILPVTKATGVEDDLNDEISLKIFPNPTSGKIEISYSIDKPGTISMELFNLIGEKISSSNKQVSEAGNYSENLSLEGFPAGIYLLKVGIKQSSILKKIILTH